MCSVVLVGSEDVAGLLDLLRILVLSQLITGWVVSGDFLFALFQQFETTCCEVLAKTPAALYRCELYC